MMILYECLYIVLRVKEVLSGGKGLGERKQTAYSLVVRVY